MSCGGRGSRTLVLLTYYRNFDTCVGADQTTGRAFHHRILRKRGKRSRDLYVPSQVTREAHYAAASICARGVILTTLAFICFAISKHDCLHDSLPSISNQNQNTPKSPSPTYLVCLTRVVARRFKACWSVWACHHVNGLLLLPIPYQVHAL